MVLRSLSRIGAGVRFDRFLCRSLAAAICFAIGANSARAQGPDEIGQWDPQVFDWCMQFNAAAPANCQANTIGHAALISTGLYRGKVLLWNAITNPPGGTCTTSTTKTYLFDPASPQQLIEIGQALPSDIFCSGMSFDSEGRLVVVGGEAGTGGEFAKNAYRLNPRTLGAASGSPPSISPSPGSPPWQALSDMQLGRNYPTIVTLIRRALLGVCDSGTSYLGGAAFVLGGRTGMDMGVQAGTEIWEVLNPGPMPSWACPLIPLPPSGADPYPLVDFPFTAHQVSGPTVVYEPKKAPGAPSQSYPEVDLDSYPRAYQLSTGEILVASDVDKVFLTCPCAGFPQGPGIPHLQCPVNHPGHSWVIKPRYSPFQSSWELWRAPIGAQDRWWGSAVLMHIREQGIPNLNRILVLGGSDVAPQYAKDCAGGSAVTLGTVHEFRPNPLATDGSWLVKIPLNHPRFNLNSVVLPTGQILVHGGQDHVPGGTVLPPELYDPGRTPTGTQALPIDLALANDAPAAVCPPTTGTGKFPRRNHHVSILLPDGRVLVAGGSYNPGEMLPNSSYTAEIFDPHYLHYGFRPVIVEAPASASFSSTSPETYSVTASIDLGNTVERVVLIRPGAVTHHFDNDQRYIEQAFSTVIYGAIPPSRVNATITVTAPDEGLGPAGWYMLFIVERRSSDGKLAPSVAEFIQLQ